MLVIPTRGMEAAGHSHVVERYFALNDRPASSGKETLAAKEALGGPDFNREQRNGTLSLIIPTAFSTP